MNEWSETFRNNTDKLKLKDINRATMTVTALPCTDNEAVSWVCLFV